MYYSGGLLSLGGFAISGTTDDSFYATRRFGKSFSYAIPVTPGDYQVRLLFADESYAAGGRIFNVSAEGSVVLKNYDIVAKAGKAVATSETFIAHVADGKLDLAFAGVLNNATLSAIEVTPLTDVHTITWEERAASPVRRAEANGATVDGKLYVFGGYVTDPTGHIVAQYRCDVYDPATNQWTRLGDMPENFTHSGIAVDGATIWLVGQYSGDHPGPGSVHVWKYDTTSDTWTRGPELPQPRGAGAAAIVGRQLHFFGGMDETRTIECGEHWSLDLDNESAGWTPRATMPNPRNHIAGAGLNGKVYALGGQHGQEASQDAQSEVDCYDPETDSWSVVAPIPDVRSHAGAATFVMNGRIVMLGGEIAYNTQRSTVFAYDPSANAWSLIGILPQPRSTSVAGALSATQLILTSGNDPNAADETWVGTLI
jgi:N-acetylneuraminic acid mutarotase